MSTHHQAYCQEEGERMPLELVCHACDLTLQAGAEAELADLVERHALSIHGHAPPREHVLARIRHHNG